MKCLKCESKTKVVQTKEYEGAVYRKRKCLKCGFIYCTEEIEIDNDAPIIKEAFSHCKKEG